MIRRFAERIAPLLLVAGAIAGLGGCTSEESPLRVWTNVAEVAFVVEHYNAAEDERVEVTYVENLAEVLTQEVTPADVVIGRWVNTPTVNRFMVQRDIYTSLPAGENEQRQERSQFTLYVPRELLALQNAWIPVSFNLPTVAFLRGLVVPPRPIVISLPEIAMAVPEDGAPVSFAPVASTATMYALHRSLGLTFRTDELGNPELDSESLRRSSAAIAAWRSQEERSADAERTYAARYFTSVPDQQLRAGRVGFHYFSSGDLFSWSFFARPDIDFRWLADTDGRIFANDDVVYAGIPQSTDRRTAAARFLSWMMQPDTQIKIAREKIVERVDSFGFLEGISTLPSVNRVLSGEIYPQLAGRIPQPTSIIPPLILPRYWNEAVEQTIGPLLADEASVATLQTALDRWYNQRGD